MTEHESSFDHRCQPVENSAVVASVGGPLWFPEHPSVEGADERAFLGRVRELAPGTLGFRVTSAATWATSAIGGACLAIRVPELPENESPVVYGVLQVRFEGGELGGYWGCHHMWDDFDERDNEALVVRGVQDTPDQFAQWAVEWVARQLHRRLVRQDWLRRGAVVGSRWVLADGNQNLGRRGRCGRLGGRQPDRTVALWPPVASG